jgi:hypothetical protein
LDVVKYGLGRTFAVSPRHPSPVGCFRRAVKTDAKPDLVARKQLEPLGVEQRSVRLHYETKPRRCCVTPENVHKPLHPTTTQQQRLASMKLDSERVKLMILAMLSDPQRELSRHVIRNICRPATPRVVAAVVDVAIRTVKIAALRNLENNLTEVGLRQQRLPSTACHTQGRITPLPRHVVAD